MSSWFSFAPHPTDKILYDLASRHPEHREYVQPTPTPTSSFGAKTTKVVTAAGVGIAAIETAERVIASPTVQTVTQKVTQTVTENIPEGVKETAAGAADAAGSVFSTIGETIGDYFSSARSAWGWATWGFSWLPGSVKIVVLGAGAIGAYQLYNFIRYPQGYAGSNTVNSNVNVHLNMPQIPSHCTPEVTTTTAANGDKNVHVGLKCVPADRKANIDRLATAMMYEQQLEKFPKDPEVTTMIGQLHKTPVTAKGIAAAHELLQKKVQGTKAYHQRLKNAKELALPDALKQSVENLCERFDELENQGYADPRSKGLCENAKGVLARVEEQVQLKTLRERITYIVENQLNFIKDDEHLVEDLKTFKGRLDRNEVKGKKLPDFLKQLDHVVAMANKSVEGYLGGKVLSKLRNNR
ncbi:MAG: hypothetical protein JSR37_07930 [Verrucomicrobia bacterium]|nr:hypothetical protein [Verrucomicrobiota bacterium]MBS0637465.1 hypothetical protein [Verrucomicrobiota bacterium]